MIDCDSFGNYCAFRILSEKICAPDCFSSLSEIVQILNLMIDKEEYKIFYRHLAKHLSVLNFGLPFVF